MERRGVARLMRLGGGDRGSGGEATEIPQRRHWAESAWRRPRLPTAAGIRIHAIKARRRGIRNQDRFPAAVLGRLGLRPRSALSRRVLPPLPAPTPRSSPPRPAKNRH